MTTLAASSLLAAGRSRRTAPAMRREGLRALLARMAAAARGDAARRSLAKLPAHLRRDIGLGEIDGFDL